MPCASMSINNLSPVAEKEFEILLMADAIARVLSFMTTGLSLMTING